MSQAIAAAPQTDVKAKTCFVIMADDQRGREVYDAYLAPACAAAGFRPLTADDDLRRNIARGIETQLGTAPVVLAYLGRKEWNHNVMLELGYRLATRKPLVMLCDEAEDAKGSLDLPFSITTEHVIRLPRRIPSATSELQPKIDTIKREIGESSKEARPFQSNQAVAVIHAPAEAGLDRNEAWYVDSSPLADRIFGCGSRLAGRSLADFYDNRRSDMPNYQYDAFMAQQQQLLTSCDPMGPPVIADVPIVVRREDGRGRAYLPVIVRAAVIGDIQELVVMYLDVTSTCRLARDPYGKRKRYWRCRLNPHCSDLFVDADVGVFLAHNSLDKTNFVLPIYEKLWTNGGNPWLDAKNIPVGRPWTDAIVEAIRNCRSAMLFLGANGLGKYEKLEEAQLVSQGVNRSIPILTVLLPGHPPEDQLGWLSSYPTYKFHEVNDEEWIQEFVQQLYGDASNGQPPPNRPK